MLKINQEELKTAFESLVRELDAQAYKSRFDDTGNDGIVKCDCWGEVELYYSFGTTDSPSMRIINFRLNYEGVQEIVGILGYTSILDSLDTDAKRLRKRLVEQESIDAIIVVKYPGVIKRQIAFVLFDKNGDEARLMVCDTLKDAVGCLSGSLPDGITIFHSDNLLAENLHPAFYYDPLHSIAKGFHYTVLKRLEEIADVIGGKSANSTDYLSQGIPYLRARDIQQGVIVKPDVYLPPSLASQFSKQLLQEGDILLTKHFGQRKLALVTSNNLPAIASEALFIIRPFGVSENYLFRYLTSKTGNAVFNEQLRKLERGAVPSIRLSELKLIEVPIYDDDTMLDIERIDSLNEHEGIETALRIMQSIDVGDGASIERQVRNDLLLAGWDETKLVRHTAIHQNERMSRFADYVYILPDDTKVVFEIKRRIASVSREWVSAIKEILQGDEKYFYILTTGLYYEAHFTGRIESYKCIHAPTIEELINWERGLE